eukprot:4355491-Prymnesium_polylepis.1
MPTPWSSPGITSSNSFCLLALLLGLQPLEEFDIRRLTAPLERVGDRFPRQLDRYPWEGEQKVGDSCHQAVASPVAVMRWRVLESRWFEQTMELVAVQSACVEHLLLPLIGRRHLLQDLELDAHPTRAKAPAGRNVVDPSELVQHATEPAQRPGPRLVLHADDVALAERALIIKQRRRRTLAEATLAGVEDDAIIAKAHAVTHTDAGAQVWPEHRRHHAEGAEPLEPLHMKDHAVAMRFEAT